MFINSGSCDIILQRKVWRERKSRFTQEKRSRLLFKEQRDNSTHYNVEANKFINEGFSRSKTYPQSNRHTTATKKTGIVPLIIPTYQ
jgi:hypothetical protein